MDNIPYTLCKHCDHFVDPNDCLEDFPADEQAHIAKFIHLEDGEQEFDHDAEPGETKLGHEWQRDRPDLFQEHPDGAIGPNSFFHSRRGKDDGLWYEDEIYRRRIGVCEKLFGDWDFEPEIVKEYDAWQNDGDTFTLVYYLENGDESSVKKTFTVKFRSKTQVAEISV